MVGVTRGEKFLIVSQKRQRLIETSSDFRKFATEIMLGEEHVLAFVLEDGNI